MAFPTPPTGYEAHQEASTQILMKQSTHDATQAHPPAAAEAFINPVQEYNRDLSVSVIRTWASIRNNELLAQSQSRKERKQSLKNKRPPPPATSDPQQIEPNSKKIKQETESVELDESHSIQLPEDVQPGENLAPPTQPTTNSSNEPQHKFSALEALSATGLRAIRYAKEIPSLKSILANDLSPSAVKMIKMNLTHNGLDPADNNQEGKVQVNQGDACDLMYAHRAPNRQFDVVDLDPYGSAAPFIDAAVQCVRNGGLLCVTCTDLAVLAGSAYPEKCFSNYGGSSMRAEYSHEYALRQVMHALASSGARYGRQIEPMLSLSIDFYVRVFVRVYDSAAEVKKCITNTALVYVCVGCGAFHMQELGRQTCKPSKSGRGAPIVSYHNAAGPPMPGTQCAECGGTFRVAGPLWSGPLHNHSFCQQLLDSLRPPPQPPLWPLKTLDRIQGMVGLAMSELPEAPFFFTPAKLSGLFRCSSPSLITVGSAILNGGFSLSRSHCQPGSIKTDAPRAFLHDLMKAWIDSQASVSTTPASKDADKPGSLAGDDGVADDGKIRVEDAEGKKISPACAAHQAKNSSNAPLVRLLSIPSRYDVNLGYNKLVETCLNSSVKIVRYQANPAPHWGPKARAAKK